MGNEVPRLAHPATIKTPITTGPSHDSRMGVRISNQLSLYELTGLAKREPTITPAVTAGRRNKIKIKELASDDG